MKKEVINKQQQKRLLVLKYNLDTLFVDFNVKDYSESYVYNLKLSLISFYNKRSFYPWVFCRKVHKVF